MRRVATAVVAASLLFVGAGEAQRRHPALAVERAYRQALGDLAAGSLELAVGRVVGIEEVSSARCVRAIETHTAQKLAERAPESIVPLAALRLAFHEALHERWRRAVNLFEFERLSIDGLETLGDLYLATSELDEARSTTAGLLTCLADMVAAARSAPRLDRARSLLETAAALDPGDPAILLSMAVNLELRGRPGQALPHLERLLALEPGEPRYRLRHALVTLESGRVESGRRLLEELTTTGPVWIQSLAIQELARLEAAAGRADRAEALLREGLKALPGEKLSLQLAAHLDPRWSQSVEALGTVAAAPQADAGPSPRWIYEDGAREEIDALRRRLESAAEDRAPVLEQALFRLPGIADDARESDDDATVRQTLEILAACR